MVFKNLKSKSLARLRLAARMFGWMFMAVSLTLYILGLLCSSSFFFVFFVFLFLFFFVSPFFWLCFSFIDHPLTCNVRRILPWPPINFLGFLLCWPSWFTNWFGRDWKWALYLVGYGGLDLWNVWVHEERIFCGTKLITQRGLILSLPANQIF